MRFQHYQAIAREAANLRQALEDRKVIERAKGVLMKRGHLDEPEAFRRDVPQAQVQRVDGGHFALDTAADEIANLVDSFLTGSR